MAPKRRALRKDKSPGQVAARLTARELDALAAQHEQYFAKRAQRLGAELVQLPAKHRAAAMRYALHYGAGQGVEALIGIAEPGKQQRQDEGWRACDQAIDRRRRMDGPRSATESPSDARQRRDDHKEKWNLDHAEELARTLKRVDPAFRGKLNTAAVSEVGRRGRRRHSRAVKLVARALWSAKSGAGLYRELRKIAELEPLDDSALRKARLARAKKMHPRS